MDRLICS